MQRLNTAAIERNFSRFFKRQFCTAFRTNSNSKVMQSDSSLFEESFNIKQINSTMYVMTSSTFEVLFETIRNFKCQLYMNFRVKLNTNEFIKI